MGIIYPKIKGGKGFYETTSEFRGLDRRPVAGSKYFSSSEGIVPDSYPSAGARPPHGIIAELDTDGCCLFYNNGLGWMTSNDHLYYRGMRVNSSFCTSDSDSTIRIAVNMGTKVLFFPDKTCYDTANGDFYALEACFKNTGFDDTVATVTLRHENGVLPLNITCSASAPAEPLTGDIYFYSDDGVCRMFRYNEYGNNEWNELQSMNLRFSHAEIEGFYEGDYVSVTGLSPLNSSYRVSSSADGVYVTLEMPPQYDILTSISQSILPVHSLEFLGTVKREVPKINYACVCGNRVWGVSIYKNEIYASKLGDERNWNCFEGRSDDSYVMSLGSDGSFTGAVNYLDDPVFFKEDRLIRIFGTKPSNFSMNEAVCPGIKRNCFHSAAVNGTQIYYYGNDGVYVYDGSSPRRISDRLCIAAENRGIHGAVSGGRYYIGFYGAMGSEELLEYDIARDIWFCVGKYVIDGLLGRPDDLYMLRCIENDGDEKDVVTKLRYCELTDDLISIQKESQVNWKIRTGDLLIGTERNTTLKKVTLSLECMEGSSVTVAVLYNEDEERILGYLNSSSGKKQTFSFTPRKSDSIRISLYGQGECRLLTMTKHFQKTSQNT